MAITEKRIILYILYVIIVAGLIVGIALAFRPKNTANTSTQSSNHPAGSSVSTKSNPQISSSSSTNKSSNSTFSTSSSTPSSTSSTSKQTTSGTASKALTNTGPGDTIGIFMVTSVAASLLWRRKLVRNVIR